MYWDSGKRKHKASHLVPRQRPLSKQLETAQHMQRMSRKTSHAAVLAYMSGQANRKLRLRLAKQLPRQGQLCLIANRTSKYDLWPSDVWPMCWHDPLENGGNTQLEQAWLPHTTTTFVLTSAPMDCILTPKPLGWML